LQDGVEILRQEEDKKQGLIKFTGRQAGEVLSNLPLGQTVASIYPEYGNKELGFPTRKELFGREDPTRFGSGVLATKGLQDPLFKLIPPYGGSQVKKTMEGLTSFAKGYVGKETGVKFPVDQNIPNAVKSALFGQYSTPEAERYFQENRKPLSELQSGVFKILGKDYYQSVIDERAKDKKLKEVKSGGTIESQDYKIREEIIRQKVLQTGKAQEFYGRLYYPDSSKPGSVSSYNIAKQKYSETNALYSDMASKLKATGDVNGWVSVTQDYISYLKDYSKTLTAPDEKDDSIRLGKKIRDLEESVAKYKSYKSFTKPKKPAKVSIKRVSVPKLKIRKGGVKNIKIISPKKIKIKSLSRKYTIKA
jgi:hypothetical protein